MSTNNILILGKGGQVGNALAALLGERAALVAPDEADFSHPDFIGQLERHTGGRRFAAVINAAAYTAVDQAEGEGRELSDRINAQAVGELAEWCKKQRLPLVHYSTDYVFDGSGDAPRRETDSPSPLNAYGHGKLAGERLLAASGADFLLLRTSWLYDATGKNFFNTIRRLLREKDELTIVADQVGAPTYTPHLAEATLAALNTAMGRDTFPSGIYHLCNAGATSWHGFASAIFEREKQRKADIRCKIIKPIPSSSYPLPARRPLNSRLDCGKAKATFGIIMPDWQAGLDACYNAL